MKDESTTKYYLIALIFLLIGINVKIKRSEIKASNELLVKDSIITLLNDRCAKNDTLLHDLVTLPSQPTIEENKLIIKHFKK